MNLQLPQELLEELARGEVGALLEGLKDPEMRKNPAFLAKIRQFLKDNEFLTTSNMDGVKELMKTGLTIPDLIGEDVTH